MQTSILIRMMPGSGSEKTWARWDLDGVFRTETPGGFVFTAAKMLRSLA